jgi:high affinity sulfate transporter 1
MTPAAIRWLPGVALARSYERAWLPKDVVAGLALAAFLLPTGMGYARASGLPPVTGLYATIIPLVVYALVGPSRILVLGPDSALAPVIAASVVVLAAGDPERAVALAGLLAVLMGLALLLGGVLRLGFVTDLLSKPIRLGYLNGIAVVVIVSQVPTILGDPGDGGSVVDQVRHVAATGLGGTVHVPTLAVGLGALVVTVGLRVLRSPVPGVLVAVLVAMAATAALGLGDDVAVVGELPPGLPAPALGGLTWQDVGPLVGPALGVALITFADTSVLSRSLAARRGETVDGSQEMAAMGVVNVAAGAFGGFPVSASSSRTPVAEQAGARSQFTGVVGALGVLAFLVLARDVTAYLPTAALAAIVVVAAATLVDLPGLLRLARMSRTETLLSASAFLGVVLVGPLEGIVIALGLSLLAFVTRAWRPYRAELVRVEGIKGYHDVERHPEGHRIPGLVIARFDAPLFFANGTIFAEFVRSLVESAPEPVHRVVVAAEPITGIDTTAVDDLARLDDWLGARGIDLVFAEMKGPIKDRIVRYGMRSRFDPDHFYPTLGRAVSDYRADRARDSPEAGDDDADGGETPDSPGPGESSDSPDPGRSDQG